MKKLVVGITGSVAAYKMEEVIDKIKDEYDIRVVMTDKSTYFSSKEKFEKLTKKDVIINLFNQEALDTIHIDIIKESDALLIAPCSANTLNKISNGIADNALTTMFLVADTNKVFIAPAMNTRMYNHPITQQNIKKLNNLGIRFIDPRYALLACGDEGIGALASIEDIVKYIREAI
ncbi:MAG: flavoprotein [Mycoplasmatales bacterium]